MYGRKSAFYLFFGVLLGTPRTIAREDSELIASAADLTAFVLELASLGGNGGLTPPNLVE